MTPTQAKLLMKAGMASGATKSDRHAVRPGTSVRSTSHAAPTPSTTQSGTVITTNPMVLTSSSATRGRAMSAHACAGPVEVTDQATYPRGTNVAATSSAMALTNIGPGRASRPPAWSGVATGAESAMTTYCAI